jgi:hypothetical protein
MAVSIDDKLLGPVGARNFLVDLLWIYKGVILFVFRNFLVKILPY